MAKILLALDYKAWQQKGQNLAMANAIVYAPATKEHHAVVASCIRLSRNFDMALFFV